VAAISARTRADGTSLPLCSQHVQLSAYVQLSAPKKFTIVVNRLTFLAYSHLTLS
jgi:hypothetical protein